MDNTSELSIPTNFETLKTVDVKEVLSVYLSSESCQSLLVDESSSLDIIKAVPFGNWKELAEDVIESLKKAMAPWKSEKTGKTLKITKVSLSKRSNLFATTSMEVQKKFAKKNMKYFYVKENQDDSLKNHSMAVALMHAIRFTKYVKYEMKYHISLGKKKVKDIVNTAFTSGIETIEKEFNDKRTKEALYYITGWMLHAINQASNKRRKELGNILQSIVIYSTMDSKEKAKKELPALKIEKCEKLDGLKYSNQSFFNFILRMEYIFVNLLTPELLVMNGSGLINSIFVELASDSNAMKLLYEFTSDEYNKREVNEALKFISQTYCRMRGKDFCRRLMAIDTNSLSRNRRDTLATLSSSKTYANGQKGSTNNDDAIDNDDLVTAAKFQAVANNAAEFDDDYNANDDENLFDT